MPQFIPNKNARAVPTIPAQAPKRRYKVPMSLSLAENNQWLMNMGKIAEEALDCESKHKG